MPETSLPQVNAVQGNTSNTTTEEIYTVSETNWYKSLAYGFVFYDRASSGKGSDVNTKYFYLPIAPSNLNITTNFATNVVTTLFGVVEEHSEVRYYDIEISGTTGISPRFIEKRAGGIPTASIISEGRKGVDFGGFLPKVSNTVNQIVKTIGDIKDSLTGGGQVRTGVDVYKTGYIAFHNFYRFLLDYKKDAAGVTELGNQKRKTHPIDFLNYKDGNKYHVAIQSFTLVRSAESPMLYNYNIKMRGYNLRSVDANPKAASQLDKLGLGSIKGQSVFTSITGAVGSATNLMSGLL